MMPGFWTKTPDGRTVHINGDPNMSDETAEALGRMMDALVAQEKSRGKAFQHLWNTSDRKAQGVDLDIALWWFKAGADLREQGYIDKLRELAEEMEGVQSVIAQLEQENNNLRDAYSTLAKGEE